MWPCGPGFLHLSLCVSKSNTLHFPTNFFRIGCYSIEGHAWTWIRTLHQLLCFFECSVSLYNIGNFTWLWYEVICCSREYVGLFMLVFGMLELAFGCMYAVNFKLLANRWCFPAVVCIGFLFYRSSAREQKDLTAWKCSVNFSLRLVILSFLQLIVIMWATAFFVLIGLIFIIQSERGKYRIAP